MRWSNLTVMGRLIILTLLALAAIGVLGAQPHRHKLNCKGGVEYSGGCAPDPDAVWTVPQDGTKPPKEGTIETPGLKESADKTFPPIKELKPTEVQSLRLQVRQKDALLAKANLEQAQRAFQQALTDLSNEGERIKQDNGWPKDTTFDPNTLQYAPAPAKDAKKEK